MESEIFLEWIDYNLVKADFPNVHGVMEGEVVIEGRGIFLRISTRMLCSTPWIKIRSSELCADAGKPDYGVGDDGLLPKKDDMYAFLSPAAIII